MDQQNLLSRQLDFTDKDDPYYLVKSDFTHQFYKHNLDSLTNPADLGFLDISKNYMDPFANHLEDHTSLLEPETTQGMRLGGHFDDLDSYQNNLRASTYSPMGRSHPAGGHYNTGMNANFQFNKQQQHHQQQYQHGGYHPQGYYYSNHYDAPMQHGDGMDYYHSSHGMDSHHDDPLSYMWSDESAKTMKMKMHGGYHGEAKNNRYEQDHHDDYHHDRIVKMQEMSRLPVRKGLEPQLKGMNPLSIDPNSIDVKNPAMKGMSGSMKFGARLSPKRAPAGKPDLFDDDDDDGDDGYGEGKGRSTRGLRVLSLKVKEIVSQKKRTSYKEVAETLTYELRQKMASRSVKEESKDEQNVKRRVYDALNVLIAADVLRKEGKIVYCDDAAGAHGYSGRKRGSENVQKIRADIEEAKKRNRAKIEQLHELIFKCLAIKNLVKTNKEKIEGDQKNPKKLPANVNATRIEVVQENPALKPKNDDVIRFPFIVLLSSSTENSMNLNMDTMQRQLAIESKKPFNIFGDIDVLLKMGLHYVSRQMFDENIPLELQRYVPKYFLAALK